MTDELEALGLAAAESAERLAERQIAESGFLQEGELGDDLRAAAGRRFVGA